jgi:hypothetical protein
MNGADKTGCREALRELADDRFLASVDAWEGTIRAHRANSTKAIASADRPKRLAALAGQRQELGNPVISRVLPGPSRNAGETGAALA